MKIDSFASGSEKSRFIQALNKMFATYYYDPEMSKMDFDYQLVSLKDSLKRVAESLENNKK